MWNPVPITKVKYQGYIHKARTQGNNISLLDRMRCRTELPQFIGQDEDNEIW